jgi:hypothetical protein
MGKASSSKKVARAARAGGRVSSGQPRSLLFPGVLALIVLLGIGLVIYARNDRLDDDLGGVPQLGDHIHQAFGVTICGEAQPPIPEFESDVGIHTHGDGVIHIHPFSQLGVGANATLGRFFEDARDQGGIEVELSDSRLEYLGTVAEEGETECEGVDDPVLRMAYWPSVQDTEADPEVTTGGFADTRLTDDGGGITLYYGDPDDDIPKPESAAQLTELGAADGGSTLEDPETGATTTSTTAAVDPTATTVAGDTTTSTTAPG